MLDINQIGIYNQYRKAKNMKTIKIQFFSMWCSTQTFETTNLKEAQNICEEGINQQYLVYVNGEKYKPIKSFGRKVL